MKMKLYTSKGELKGDVSMPKEYDQKISSDLLKQAIKVYEDRTHFGLSKVKTRSEVNLTKKKLYKQKGTGGARHGAKSAHIFVGGGVVHGPTGVKRDLNLPIKMKKKALRLAIASKIKSGKLVLVEGFDKLNKTKDADKIINALRKALDIKSTLSIVLSDKNTKSRRFIKNIDNVKLFDFRSLNAFNVLTSNFVFVDSECFEKNKSQPKADRPVDEKVKVNKQSLPLRGKKK